MRYELSKKSLRQKLNKKYGLEACLLLILTRLFDGFLFEWISYAAGLTQISFKRYFLITAICSVPYNLIALYFAQRVSDLGQLFVSLSVVYYVTLSLPFLYIITKKIFLRKYKHRYVSLDIKT